MASVVSARPAALSSMPGGTPTITPRLLFISAPSIAELRANLANLAGVLGTTADKASIDEQLAAVLGWLDAHPGWLLIIDNVDTEEAAAEVQRLLARLRAATC